MHPSKFFDEVRLINKNIPVEEKEEMKQMFANIHPMNWIASDLQFCISKITVAYDTNKGNRKETEKYSIQLLDMKSDDDPDMQAEIQADSDINKFLTIHPHVEMFNYKILKAEVIAIAVLRIE